MPNQLIQFSNKFIIDPTWVKAIAPVSGSNQMFAVFTERQIINIDYDEFKKLKKYLLENAMMRKLNNVKDSEDED